MQPLSSLYPHVALAFAPPTDKQTAWAHQLLGARPANRHTLRRVLRAYRIACSDSNPGRGVAARVAAANMARAQYHQACVLLAAGARHTR
jgi:hypothetical protein